MSKEREALKLALEALAASDDFLFNYHDCEPNNEREVDAYSEVRGNNMKAWEAIREALAEQPAQQEPDKYLLEVECTKCGATEKGVLTFTPQSKPWVGLTNEEIDLLEDLYAPPIHPDFVNDADHCTELIRRVEAKLREKNAPQQSKEDA